MPRLGLVRLGFSRLSLASFGLSSVAPLSSFPAARRLAPISVAKRKPAFGDAPSAKADYHSVEDAEYLQKSTPLRCFFPKSLDHFAYDPQRRSAAQVWCVAPARGFLSCLFFAAQLRVDRTGPARAPDGLDPVKRSFVQTRHCNPQPRVTLATMMILLVLFLLLVSFLLLGGLVRFSENIIRPVAAISVSAPPAMTDDAKSANGSSADPVS